MPQSTLSRAKAVIDRVSSMLASHKPVNAKHGIVSTNHAFELLKHLQQDNFTGAVHLLNTLVETVVCRYLPPCTQHTASSVRCLNTCSWCGFGFLPTPQYTRDHCPDPVSAMPAHALA